MRIVTVGRSGDNTVCLNDEYVNDSHCRLVQHDNGYIYISDLNSTNGTFVNGLRIVGEVALNPHDMVRVGGTTLPWQSYFPQQECGCQGGYAQQQQQQPRQPQYQQQSGQPQRRKPESFLVWAILSTIFCCLPFGVVSIVYAADVDGKWRDGDFDGAERAARNARTWFWWSFGVGLGGSFLWLLSWLIWGVALGVGSAFA